MLTKEQLNEIETKFPGCVHVKGTWGEVVVRPPIRHELKRLRKRVQDPNYKDSATEECITDCVVYPDRDAFQAMLDKPGQGLLCERISLVPDIAEWFSAIDIRSAKISSP